MNLSRVTTTIKGRIQETQYLTDGQVRTYIGRLEDDHGMAARSTRSGVLDLYEFKDRWVKVEHIDEAEYLAKSGQQ